MHDDVDLLAELDEPTPEQEWIAAALATLARVARESAADEGSHDLECWLAHTGCLAARLGRQLRGEVVDGG